MSYELFSRRSDTHSEYGIRWWGWFGAAYYCWCSRNLPNQVWWDDLHDPCSQRPVNDAAHHIPEILSSTWFQIAPFTTCHSVPKP